MATYGMFGSHPDRLTGVFLRAPTDFAGGDVADFYAHCAARREAHLSSDGATTWAKRAEWPQKAVEHARISTAYIPLYRIHSKRYFKSGPSYPVNWEPSERRQSRRDRYSPPGVEGFYFGLSLEAAEDEARYYGGGRIDDTESMILLIECCLDNILYLTSGVIDAVWSAARLPAAESTMAMYVALMDPDTSNHVTDHIGQWARDEGFDGLIFPSARYGQAEWLRAKKSEGYALVPAINFVDVGSHLCRAWPTPALHFYHAVNKEIERLGGIDRCIPVFAEQNLVLFDGRQVSGESWGVVYQTFPIEMRDAVLAQDDPRRYTKAYAYWSTDMRPNWLEGRCDAM